MKYYAAFKKTNPAIYAKIKGHEGHYAKLNKPGTEGQILCDNIFHI